ncbi:MAG TPA: ABC transporter substrate-binding protein [Polyangiaceae bacterium]|nr:ABC transporter substrate-binding protein [Polyangiaceae bacterium]
MKGAGGFAIAWLGLCLAACSNDPYPNERGDEKVLYLPFAEPPKTLDPAEAYSTVDHSITARVFDTLLEYHYLKRPYELFGSLAEAVPEPRQLEDGRVEYRFELRADLRFAADECFARFGTQSPDLPNSRRITADDVVFELRRLADPAVGSPVIDQFALLSGFADFGARLEARRKADAAFARRRADEQYRELGGFVGARSEGERTVVVTLDQPYPQILYWFAMNFTSPLPWEAVAHYDGKDGRDPLAEHPVASGPFQLVRYEKRARIVLEKNPLWHGVRHPEWRAPGTVFPALDDVPNLSPAEKAGYATSVGQQLPRLARIEYIREEESIPAFSKFLQGYYDISSIARENFNQVVHEGGLSDEMRSRGMQLEKTVTAAVFYIGFNLDDPQIGSAGGERTRLLRQAMSLAIDSTEYARLFMNGRGIAAQSPLPPGLFGYDEAYRNPYRQPSVERARELLIRAGYPGGIDPKTGRPLHLTFDVGDTSPEGAVRFHFWTNQWRQIGIDVELAATNYNKFQEKVRDGAYQLFTWGWVADYPDPENFYFLLTTRMARSVSGGPNSANFKNAAFDETFERMKAMENGPERRQLLERMRGILQEECPWIPLFHPEDYALLHGFAKDVKPIGISSPVIAKYYDVDAARRRELRTAWNEPVLWPAALFVLALVALLVPAVRTFLRERQ